MRLQNRIMVLVPSLALVIMLPASSPGQNFRTGSGVAAGSAASGSAVGAYNIGSNYNSGINSSYGLSRSQNTLANPVNYFQYSQITGTGPSIGTVATYNQFGLAGMAFGGALNGGSQGTQGSAPPPGVLMSVNNAQMFYPNQMQINNLGFNYPLSPYSMYGYGGMGYPGMGYGAAGLGMAGLYGGYGYPGLYGMGYPGLYGGLGGLGGLGTGINVGQNQNVKPAGN